MWHPQISVRIVQIKHRIRVNERNVSGILNVTSTSGRTEAFYPLNQFIRHCIRTEHCKKYWPNQVGIRLTLKLWYEWPPVQAFAQIQIVSRFTTSSTQILYYLPFFAAQMRWKTVSCYSRKKFTSGRINGLQCWVSITSGLRSQSNLISLVGFSFS